MNKDFQSFVDLVREKVVNVAQLAHHLELPLQFYVERFFPFLPPETFAKVGQNALIHTKPSVIHFEGFEVGEKQTRKLVLLNASSDILRMHIIPPQSRHFYIRYNKPVSSCHTEKSMEHNLSYF